jgi:hypothetical protein
MNLLALLLTCSMYPLSAGYNTPSRSNTIASKRRDARWELGEAEAVAEEEAREEEEALAATAVDCGLCRATMRRTESAASVAMVMASANTTTVSSPVPDTLRRLFSNRGPCAVRTPLWEDDALFVDIIAWRAVQLEQTNSTVELSSYSSIARATCYRRNCTLTRTKNTMPVGEVK